MVFLHRNFRGDDELVHVALAFGVGQPVGTDLARIDVANLRARPFVELPQSGAARQQKGRATKKKADGCRSHPLISRPPARWIKVYIVRTRTTRHGDLLCAARSNHSMLTM